MKMLMKNLVSHVLVLISCIFLVTRPCVAQAQENRSDIQRVRTPATSSNSMNAETREAAAQALARLRVLRDGWNDVNRAFITPHFVAGEKLDSQVYAIQYLEAKTAVDQALQVLPKGEVRTAIEQAMDIFDDLEAITKIFRKNSPFTTDVRVTDIFPYLKKYHVPYESGIVRASYGLTLHQDFVLSYVLPIRYARINRVEVMLGGKVEPIPPPPTYEKMHRVRPLPKTPNVSAEELKEIVRQAIEARLRGNREQMAALLDNSFMFYGRESQDREKEMYLKKMTPDPTVKRFEIEQAELKVWNYQPTLSTTIRYESLMGQFKSFKNTFRFVNHNGKWLIETWSSF